MHNATPYVTIPTIELIRQELCAHPVGTLVATSVRSLARAVRRSAGQISVHLDRLEADGWIRRLADSGGTIVEVLRSDQGHDRSFSALESDHADDPPAQSDHPSPMPSPVSARVEVEQTSDHAADPPLHPPIRYKHESHEQQQRATHESVNPPLAAALLREGCAEDVIARILAACPERTPAEFEIALAANARRFEQGRAATPTGLVFGLWAEGQRLVEELRHEHRRRSAHAVAQRPDTPPAAARRAATARRSSEASDADIERLRASFAAAPPLCIDVRLPELRR